MQADFDVSINGSSLVCMHDTRDILAHTLGKGLLIRCASNLNLLAHVDLEAGLEEIQFNKSFNNDSDDIMLMARKGEQIFIVSVFFSKNVESDGEEREGEEKTASSASASVYVSSVRVAQLFFCTWLNNNNNTLVVLRQNSLPIQLITVRWTHSELETFAQTIPHSSKSLDSSSVFLYNIPSPSFVSHFALSHDAHWMTCLNTSSNTITIIQIESLFTEKITFFSFALDKKNSCPDHVAISHPDNIICVAECLSLGRFFLYTFGGLLLGEGRTSCPLLKAPFFSYDGLCLICITCEGVKIVRSRNAQTICKVQMREEDFFVSSSSSSSGKRGKDFFLSSSISCVGTRGREVIFVEDHTQTLFVVDIREEKVLFRLPGVYLASFTPMDDIVAFAKDHFVTWIKEGKKSFLPTTTTTTFSSSSTSQSSTSRVLFTPNHTNMILTNDTSLQSYIVSD